MASDYQEFLNTASEEVTDVTYDVGFHPEWDHIRLNLAQPRYPEDGDDGLVDLYLTPVKARELGQALLAAAFSLSQKQKSRV